MAQNYIQPGKSIDYTNASGSAIASGDVVVLGSHIGIAGSDIPDGETETVHMDGVFELPKAAEAIAAGVDVYWDATAGNITATVGTNTPAGMATKAAAEGDATVEVRINF